MHQQNFDIPDCYGIDKKTGITQHFRSFLRLNPANQEESYQSCKPILVNFDI